MKMVVLRTVLLLVILLSADVIAEDKRSSAPWKVLFPLSRVFRSTPPPDIHGEDNGSGSDSDMVCTQQHAQQLMGTLPADCVGYLYSESPVFRDIDFSHSYPGLCTACGEALYTFFHTCFTNSLAETMDLHCATNGMGSMCYEVLDVDGLQDCVGQDTCSSACRSLLSSRVETQGCCFYSGVFLNATEGVADQLWDSCDLSSPGLCDGAFSSSAGLIELCTLLMTVAVLLGVISML